MSEGLNRVTLFGNLGADPELKVLESGNTVLKLRMATTETFKDKAGEKQEHTEWHRVNIWGKRAEALAKFLAKGDRVLVEGKIKTDSYEKDGEKRYSTEIVASNIVLAGAGKGGGTYEKTPAKITQAALEIDRPQTDDEIPF